MKRISLLIVLVVFAGCATNGNYVSRNQTIKTAFYGTVTDTQSATIGGTSTGIGSAVGSVASVANSGYDHSLGTYLVRSLAGAVAGAIAEELITQKQGATYTIKKFNGEEVIVTTPSQPEFVISAGACVKVIIGGKFPVVTERHEDDCAI